MSESVSVNILKILVRENKRKLNQTENVAVAFFAVLLEARNQH